MIDLVTEMVNKQLRPVELQRRIKIIPFLNLSKFEQEIITIQYQDTLTAQFFQPPTDNRKIGDIEFHFDKSFTNSIVRRYDRRSGGSGIKKMVYDEVAKCFSNYMIASPKPKDAWFYQDVKTILRVKWDQPDSNEIMSTTNIENSYMDDNEISDKSIFSSNSVWVPKAELKKFDI
jgi:ATP-dependent Clp protease ATP-binding subunit ClpA